MSEQQCYCLLRCDLYQRIDGTPNMFAAQWLKAPNQMIVGVPSEERKSRARSVWKTTMTTSFHFCTLLNMTSWWPLGLFWFNFHFPFRSFMINIFDSILHVRNNDIILNFSIYERCSFETSCSRECSGWRALFEFVGNYDVITNAWQRTLLEWSCRLDTRHKFFIIFVGYI